MKGLTPEEELAATGDVKEVIASSLADDKALVTPVSVQDPIHKTASTQEKHTPELNKQSIDIDLGDGTAGELSDLD